MLRWELCPGGRAAALVICAAVAHSLAAAGRPLALIESRYELRAGEPAAISAASETLDFLSSAVSRHVKINGTAAAGLTIGSNRAGQMVVVASLRVEPGEYTATLSATSAAGEERDTPLTVVVQPRTTVPSNATRPPVVLLNGWEEGFTGSCPVAASSSETFGNLAQYLISDGVPVVYLFDNCAEDPNQTVETLGNDLASFLTSIQYDNGTQVPQIDLVAFSLGGLIVRSYLAGLQPNTEALTPPATTLVHKLVMIAVPNFGAYLAGNYVSSLLAGSQSAELVPGSALLWNLATWNQRSDDLRGINAIAVVGNAGTYSSLLTGASNANAGDGVVTETSASLGFVAEQASVTRVVPYCHVDPSVFLNSGFGTYLCNAAGIANVTSTSQQTGQIVRSFLAGTTTWTTIGSAPSSDPYLSAYGGMFFGLVNKGGGYASDVTAVAWGTVQLETGGDLDTIYYTDLVSGTGTFTATSTSLGAINCSPYTEGAGYFSAVRCKVNAAIASVGPLATTSPRVVTSGGTITISGASFSTQCGNCTVLATPAGATNGQALKIGSWSNTSIQATLPASLTGLVILTVNAVTGSDSIAIMAAAGATSTIAVSPGSLAFTYAAGGTAPAAQSVAITNSGGGTLAWSATASASWLAVSPASGTAPSALSISVSPGGLSAGTYNGSVSIVASGASNTPLAIAVTLTVAAAPAVLAVSPLALSFNYTNGGAAPASQTVAITNASGGALAWTASDADYWIAVSPASGSAPGTLAISVNPANLAAGTYVSSVRVAAAGASGSPAAVVVTLTVQGTPPAPAIAGVANAASFQPTLAAATWLAIVGTNLSTATYTWQASDFVNGALPTSLQGVSATINGIAAYVEYISPTQINVLAPDDATTGPVTVQVKVAGQTSNTLTAQKTALAPALFTIDNGAYAAALHGDYSLVGAAGLLAGVTTTPAQPGETIQLYGTGFGPTDPAVPTGQVVATAEPTANSVTVTIGGVNAPVIYTGLVEAGLYQLNVTVPAVPNGDAAVVATVNGVATPTGLAITVQQ